MVLAETALFQAFAFAALLPAALMARVLPVLTPGLLVLPRVLMLAAALTLVLARPSSAAGLLVAVGPLLSGVLPVVVVSGLLPAVLSLQAVGVLVVLLLAALKPAAALIAVLLLATLERVARVLAASLPAVPATAEALPVPPVAAATPIAGALTAAPVAATTEGALLVSLRLLLSAAIALSAVLLPPPLLSPVLVALLPTAVGDIALAVLSLLAGTALVPSALSVALPPGSTLTGRAVLVRLAVALALLVVLMVGHGSSSASLRRRINRFDCSVPFHDRGRVAAGKGGVMPRSTGFDGKQQSLVSPRPTTSTRRSGAKMTKPALPR